MICRTRADAPEIDGNAYAPKVKGVKVGDFVNLEITDADAYDLYGVAK
jgi:ribosomal protein S12 methylthiotransferase